MKASDFEDMLSGCCRIGFAGIENCTTSEQKALRTLHGEVRTVIVLAHHIERSLEWIWFRFEASRLSQTCAADLHLGAMAKSVQIRLASAGYRGCVVDYPGRSGVMFKTLAVHTGLGELGDNYLFMNADWGPWVHLRVVLTDAEIAHDKPKHVEACTHCGNCIDACPANAIAQSDFNGLKCRDYMRQTRRALGPLPHDFECERCLRVCPVGGLPEEIAITYEIRKDA